MTSETTDLRRTALHAAHVAAGARLVPFAGWEMPVQYVGVKEEHLAVRGDAGVFDVSHMGEIRTYGPQALEFLQRILSNDVAKIEVHGSQYALLLREDGGVIDDLFTYRLADQTYLTVTNAANHGKDLAWFRQQAEGFDVTVEDAADDYAMLAVQGPRARAIVESVAHHPLPGKFQIARVHVGDGERADAVDALVAGTGYTGEDGVEILLPPAAAPAVWDALLAAGAVPAGLGARDTLRLEACFHLYGNDLTEDRDPIGAGLGWAVKEDTGHIGAETTRAVRAAGPAEKLVPFRFVDKGIPRPGNPVVGGGVVTSGGYSPSLETGIGLAYVPAEQATPGVAIEVDVRGKVRPAEIAQKPLYRSPQA
ncbi:glycine cleavage system aminomethyltransferase GcvT [Patulibacter defluvii]|uniref:glycine cleavage system aminomethyltransferase GcvT n=1 Tax=Patulibacter defluvii TaxID=3095358 RepID=UPI002A75143D|nr:glycine cleavage system aminomethyltransferase GcvT [Patulibacter sp. DM4]